MITIAFWLLTVLKSFNKISFLKTNVAAFSNFHYKPLNVWVDLIVFVFINLTAEGGTFSCLQTIKKKKCILCGGGSGG